MVGNMVTVIQQQYAQSVLEGVNGTIRRTSLMNEGSCNETKLVMKLFL